MNTNTTHQVFDIKIRFWVLRKGFCYYTEVIAVSCYLKCGSLSCSSAITWGLIRNAV